MLPWCSWARSSKEADGDFWPEGEWSIRVVDESGASGCLARDQKSLADLSKTDSSSLR